MKAHSHPLHTSQKLESLQEPEWLVEKNPDEKIIEDVKKAIIDFKSGKHKNNSGDYLFVSETIKINAPAEVFNMALRINQYHLFSNGVTTARLKENNQINLKVKGLKSVTETVVVSGKIAENCWAIGWNFVGPGISLPFGGRIQRYHIIQGLPDGTTESFIGDKIPGTVGRISHHFFRKKIISSFNGLNRGIAAAAEEKIISSDEKACAIVTQTFSQNLA